MKPAYFENDGLRLAFFRDGSQKPPLLLFHGIGVDSTCWGTLPEHYSHDFEVILLDLRGHGHSELGETLFSRRDLARDAGALLNALGLRDVTIIGHSLGAEVALLTAAAFPDLVRRIVMLDPPLKPGSTHPTEQETEREIAMWLDLQHKPYNEYEQLYAEITPWMDAAALKNLFKAQRLFKPGFLCSIRAEPQGWQTAAETVTCQGLLVATAGETKPHFAADGEAELRRLWPACEVVRVPGTGHLLHLQKPESVLPLIDAFVGGG
ncbi:MAG TPA: alpha/beta hydrolase [Bellilinea sp.]|nr:alpha/beta hydrolase [Bellilinea sp.]